MKTHLPIQSVMEITLPRTDDFHHHFRDETLLRYTVPAAAHQFTRALAMPNLVPPVVNVHQAAEYRARIQACGDLDLVMTLALTDTTTEQDVEDAASSGFVHAFKLYPKGATTNSDNGVTNIKSEKISRVLNAMSKHHVLLLVHGEVTESCIDIFDRETEFLQTFGEYLTKGFPQLKIVFEHLTTADGVRFVQGLGTNVAATLTPQHLVFSRNHLLVGGLKPHNYCLPVLKLESDREVLLEAATGGSGKFFLGTDSAPHLKSRKESSCCSAGCFTSLNALQLYAEAFDSVGKINELSRFAGEYGAEFYNLYKPILSMEEDSKMKRVLKKQTSRIAASLEVPELNDCLIPFRASEELQWELICTPKKLE